MRPRTLPGLAVALAVGLACAPALRTPPPTSAPAAAPPGAGAGPTADALLAEARARFQRRPDPGEVREAVRLYLAAAETDPSATEALVGAIEAKVWLLDHGREPDAGALATSAVDDGQRCLARAPQAAACDYGLALALGMQARERRATALDGVARMVVHLRRAGARDPALDQAGPERVLALVLTRAPGWPLGPGDPEGAVAAARAAVQRFPDYPPNLLALSEALLATGATEEGHATAARAATLARQAASAGDPDAASWLAEAERLGAGPAQGGG